MTTFRVRLEYDGSRYRGWQEQKNARSVLGEVSKAARAVLGPLVELQGSGRTDAGVHARGQVMHMKAAAPVRQSPGAIRQRMNDLLPADIVILDVELAARNFHARHDAVSRAYVYQISTRKQAFLKKYVWWVKTPLRIDLMQRGAQMLIGRHDFACFHAADPAQPEKSTIVVVQNASVEAQDSLILFRIEASHFLWRMARRIVGTLVKVGAGEVSVDEFRKLIDGVAAPNLDVAAWTAPAAGLFLEEVRYD